MEPEPPQDRVLPYHYIESSDPPPHVHAYEYVGGKRTVRYCDSSFFLWKAINEESDLQ